MNLETGGQYWMKANRIRRGCDAFRTKRPHLPYPYSSGIEKSRHNHMRELRIQHQGDPYRVLYAFDPRRSAILLIGGNKVGKDRWYDEYVPIADKLYDEHLQALTDEGFI